MPESSDDHAVIPDPWNRGLPVLLSGFAERHRFEPWFAAAIVLVLSFVLFQFIIAPLAIGLALVISGVDLLALLDELSTEGMGALDEYTAQLLAANTVGLVFAFGIPALMWSRLSTPQVFSFLRLRKADWRFVVLGLAGWFVLIPIVQFAGQLNAALPWPESVRIWEQQMLEPVTRFLERPDMLVPSLLMIALAPAICEEILFRGYLQRQLERSTGVSWSIVLSGFLFGAYHLQPTKLLPLALLGGYFAFLTWRTGSLVPAMFAHFAQNAMAIILSYFFAQSGRDVAELDALVVPWYMAVGGAGLLWGVVYLLNRKAGESLRSTGATAWFTAD